MRPREREIKKRRRIKILKSGKDRLYLGRRRMTLSMLPVGREHFRIFTLSSHG